MSSLLSLLTLIAASAAAGFGMSIIQAPLPWMIGPLLLTAIASASGITSTRVPTNVRPFGQIVVATFVGAHFTPEALHALLAAAPLMIAASLWVLATALAVAKLQCRLFGGALVDNFLAVVPTSPVEAVTLAEHHNVATAPVILSQTLRIALVVTLIPVALYVGLAERPPALTAIRTDGVPGALITLAAAAVGIAIFRALRLSNPFFLGPLFMAALVSAIDLPRYDTPPVILALAQIILGAWLGGAFQRGLMKRGIFAAALVSSGLLLAICSLGALVLSRLFEAALPAVLLGIAPGGVTEMALTAGILGQDVALVTAMHLTRIFVIMPNVGWIARLSERLSIAHPKDKK